VIKASLLQSSVSHDPSEITLMMIICSRSIYDYYQCWKQLQIFVETCIFSILWWI